MRSPPRSAFFVSFCLGFAGFEKFQHKHKLGQSAGTNQTREHELRRCAGSKTAELTCLLCALASRFVRPAQNPISGSRRTSDELRSLVAARLTPETSSEEWSRRRLSGRTSRSQRRDQPACAPPATFAVASSACLLLVQSPSHNINVQPNCTSSNSIEKLLKIKEKKEPRVWFRTRTLLVSKSKQKTLGGNWK